MAQVQYIVEHRRTLHGFQKRYGKVCEMGRLTFGGCQDLVIPQYVIVQATATPSMPETIYDIRSKYVHQPILITQVERENKMTYVRVLPEYDQCLQYYLENTNHICEVLSNKVSVQLFPRIYSFSETLKQRLLELFHGIDAMHQGGVVLGNINGETMILVAIDSGRPHIGKIVGSSPMLSAGTDKNIDWKSVAQLLRTILTSKTAPAEYDNEILDQLSTLEKDTVTSKEILDHMSLWSAERKANLLVHIQNGLYAKTIKLTELTDTNWMSKLGSPFHEYALKENYGRGLNELIRFICNMVEHGQEWFKKIGTDNIPLKFSHDVKGIFALIGRAFPKFFINLLEEARKSTNFSAPIS